MFSLFRRCAVGVQLQRPVVSTRTAGPAARRFGKAARTVMITLRFHLDVDVNGDAYWTVDSHEVPSLFATGKRLSECRNIALDVLHASGIEDEHIAFALVGHPSHSTPLIPYRPR
jgi:hypothetical protein